MWRKEVSESRRRAFRNIGSHARDRARDAREVMTNVSLMVEKTRLVATTLLDEYNIAQAEARRADFILNLNSSSDAQTNGNATSSITSPERIADALKGSRWRLRRKLGAIRVEPFRMPRARVRATVTDDAKNGVYESDQETQQQNAKLLTNVRKLYRAYASRMLSIASLNYGPSEREQK